MQSERRLHGQTFSPEAKGKTKNQGLMKLTAKIVLKFGKFKFTIEYTI